MALVKEVLSRRHNMYNHKKLLFACHKFWTKVYKVLW